MMFLEFFSYVFFFLFFFLLIRRPPRSTLFPTRRSSDLVPEVAEGLVELDAVVGAAGLEHLGKLVPRCSSPAAPDRKSTRLNSSHANISYAVFCLKKKKKKIKNI